MNANPNLGTAANNADWVMRASSLSMAFGGRVILDQVDVSLREGEIVLLRGENGSGKTTLINILTGQIQPDSGKIEIATRAGPLHYQFPRRFGRVFAPERLARAGIGRTWQEGRPFRSLTVMENLLTARPAGWRETPAAIFAPFGRGDQQTRTEADAMRVLELLGIAALADARVNNLSLGQAKRVALARALMSDNRVLFLDEPLAGLDYLGAQSFLTVIRSVASALRLTLVIVEHALSQELILPFVTTEWQLAGARLVAKGVTPQTKMTSTAPGPPAWVDALESVFPQIKVEPLPSGGRITRFKRPGAAPTAKILQVEDLGVRRDEVEILGPGSRHGEAISLSVEAGEVIVLEAPNGWGKSTLVSAIAGDAQPFQGTISVADVDITGRTAWEVRRAGVRLVRADENVYADLTIAEMLKLAQTSHGSPLLKSIKADARISNLSGGERQRLALTCALWGQRDRVLILDEPFSGLDRDAILTALTMLAPQVGEAVIITIPIHHELKLELS